MTTTAAFDPQSEAFLADPLRVYRELRASEPVHFAPVEEGVYLLTRYEDIRHIVRQPDGRIQVPGVDRSAVFGDGPARMIYRNLMVLNDPPKHTRLRKLTQPLMTPQALERLRDRVERVVAEALDAVETQGTMDAVVDLAFLVPYRVICGMLGIPADQRDALLAKTPDFFRIFLPQANDAAGIQACNDACAFFIDYLGENIAERRATPTDDVLSQLVQAEEAGDKLDRDELIATILALLAGGFDTTMGMIGAGIYNFATQPEQFAALKKDPEGLAPQTFEEVVRWETPVGLNYRHFEDDVELHGVRIPAGTPIWLALLSANHDERRFADPDNVDIHRPDNRHVAFGGSRHTCVGQYLARLEGEVTFRQLAQRFDKIELAGTPRRRPDNFQFRSFERLPIRFEMANA